MNRYLLSVMVAVQPELTLAGLLVTSGGTSSTSSSSSSDLSSYCFGKIDGNYCQSANEVVTCQDNKQTDYKYCVTEQCVSFLQPCKEKFCKAQLQMASCGSPQFCKGKLDGSFCDGKVLKTCRRGEVVSSLECRDAGCTQRCKVRIGITENNRCVGQSTCGAANFCIDGLQGSYCDSGAIKTCPGNAISDVCHDGTCKDFLLQATCGDPRLCDAKLDGNHCDGKYLKTCSGGKEARSQYCGSTCSAGTGVGEDECGTSGFCLTKLDGSYCDDKVWKSCKASTMVDTKWCEGGCRSADIHAAECGPSSENATHASYVERMGAMAAAAAIATPRTIARRISLNVAEAEA